MPDVEQTGKKDAKQQKAEGEAFIEQVQLKMRKIVDEFSRGEISREQFHEIYERYQTQIIMATQLIAEADMTALAASNLSPGETIAIRKRLTAKARAVMIFYHNTGTLLETLGDFDVPATSINKLSSVLNEIFGRAQSGEMVESRTERFEPDWLLFVPGKYTTAVMLFSHEPAAQQRTIIERMHRDFEIANINALQGGNANPDKLVYPFLLFVRRSIGGKT